MIVTIGKKVWKVSQQRYESILAVGKEQDFFLACMRLKKMAKHKCVLTIAKAPRSLKP